MSSKPIFLSPGIYTIEADFAIYNPKLYRRKLKIDRILNNLKHQTKN